MMDDRRLVRVDRNGTKYWETSRCSKCGGTGYIECYRHVDGGICFQCGGTGIHTESWKEYTPEYAEKLEQRRTARLIKQAPDRNARLFKRWHLAGDGSCWVVLGDTYAIRDTLKAAGAHYHPYLGWYFDHEVVGYDCAKMSISQICELQDMYGVYQLPEYDNPKLCEAVQEAQSTYAARDIHSEYIGSVGDRVNVDATVERVAGYESDWGYINIYTFVDDKGNYLVWRTSAAHLEEGERVSLRGTIKEHSEYNHIKETVLTRCKVAELA